jgi:SAM-dependent methyltransferase
MACSTRTTRDPQSSASLATSQATGSSTRDVVPERWPQLPFADADFDDVVAYLVLHYLEDWAGPLSELCRVLKPGGVA